MEGFSIRIMFNVNEWENEMATLKSCEIEAYALGRSDAGKGRLFRHSLQVDSFLRGVASESYDLGWKEARNETHRQLRYRPLSRRQGREI